MATRDVWEQRVERWRKSGLSAEDFAARDGIKPRQLVWWRWKLSASPPRLAAPAPVQFLPVRIVDVPVRPRGAAVALEIALPNGRVVRVPEGFDPAMLARVLRIASSEGEPC
jgi:transposase